MATCSPNLLSIPLDRKEAPGGDWEPETLLPGRQELGCVSEAETLSGPCGLSRAGDKAKNGS